MVEEGLRPGVFFSNSNIVPFEEYAKRKEELARYAASFELEVVDDEYDHGAWLEYMCRGLSTGPGAQGPWQDRNVVQDALHVLSSVLCEPPNMPPIMATMSLPPHSHLPAGKTSPKLTPPAFWPSKEH